MEERLLKATARVETGAKVVGPEGSSQRSSRTLKYDGDNQKDRKPDLYERQHSLEKNHWGDFTMTVEGEQGLDVPPGSMSVVSRG